MWVTARWPIVATSSLHHDDDARLGGVEIKYEMENGGDIHLICRRTLKTHLRYEFCKT